MRKCVIFMAVAAVALTTLVLVPGVCSARGLMDSPWPEYRCNARHTGQSDVDGQSEFFPGDMAWSVDLGDRVTSSPAISNDGTIYVGCDDGALYAVSPEGAVIWSYQTEATVSSSPALDADGTIYVGSRDGHLYAVTPEGELKWRYDAGSEVITSPSIGPDGTIYVGGRDGVWYALDPDGTLRWSLETEGYLTHSSVPIGDDGTVYMVEEDGHWLYAMDADGNELRRTMIPGIIRGSPAVARGGTVYVVALGGTDWSSLVAVGSDGDISWTFNVTGFINCAPAIDTEGSIYFVTTDGFFYALDRGGSVAWHFEDTQNFTRSSPAITADGTVFVGQREGCLVAIRQNSRFYDPYTGGEVWSSPAIGGNGTVYFGSNDGHLYAYAVPDFDPEPSSITLDGGGSSMVLVAVLAIIIVGLSAAAGVFGLFYRGYGGWRTDGQVPPHAIQEDPTIGGQDSPPVYGRPEWEWRPPGGPPP